MKARRARTIVVALGGVAGLLLLAGGAYMAMSPSAGSREHKVELAGVVRTGFDIVTVATGDLQAKKQIELRNELETPATIVEVVPEGTLAKAGDVLVRLNAEEIQSEIDEQDLRVRTAQTQVVAAESAYEIQKNENGSKLRQGELKLRLAELALEQWLHGDDIQKKKDLDLAFEKATRDLERLKKKLEQSEGLHTMEFLSDNEYELDQIAVLEGEAALTRAILARQTYEEYERKKEEESKRSDVNEARAEVERITSQNDIELQEKLSALENQKAQTSLMEQKLEKLRNQLALCVIKAPTDGLVVYASSVRGDSFMFESQGPLQVGRQVYPNETLMVLPDVSAMIANVRVHESLAGEIQPGQPATVRVEALGGKAFTGVVESKGVLAEQGGWRDPNRREYTVKIALDVGPGSENLKPSMRCESEIRLGAVDSALVVPIQAVFTDGPVRFVYVPRDGKYARVPVKMGRRSQTSCEILVGLEEGDRVLVREPASGEAPASPWDPTQLQLVGLKVDDEGKPVAEDLGQRFNRAGAESAQGGSGNGQGRRGPRGGSGENSGGERPRPAGDGAKPAGESRSEGESTTEAPTVETAKAETEGATDGK